MSNITHCLNCGREVSEKFCQNCGQRTSVHRYSFKHFIEHDLIHGIWHVDNGILFTIKELFTRPGQSIREFITGKRVGYFNYITLLIIIVGVSHFFSEYSKFDFTNLMPESSKATMNELQKLSEEYPKSTLLLTIPIYSIFSFLWFRKSKLNLTENFVLNSYKTAAELIIGIAFTVITIFYTNIDVLVIIYSVIAFSTFLYSFIFYYQFFSAYGYSKKALFFRSLGVIFSYVFFYFLVGSISSIIKFFF